MKKLIAFLFGLIQGSIVTLLVGSLFLINEYRKMDLSGPRPVRSHYKKDDEEKIA